MPCVSVDYFLLSNDIGGGGVWGQRIIRLLLDSKKSSQNAKETKKNLRTAKNYRGQSYGGRKLDLIVLLNYYTHSYEKRNFYT